MLRALTLCLALVAAPGLAAAQRSVHSLSDALYVGVQAGPDLAYLFAYDLDILVTDTSIGLTLGPSFSAAFGGAGSAEHGLRQEYMLACDFVRVRGTFFQEHGMRAAALLGGGMYFTSLPEQTTDPHPAQLMDGTTVTVTEHFPGVLIPGAMLTTGFSFDWYWDGRWGLGSYFVLHARLDDQARVPEIWSELGVGIRLGE